MKTKIHTVSLSSSNRHVNYVIAWIHRNNEKNPVNSYSVETPLRLQRVRKMQDILNQF